MGIDKRALKVYKASAGSGKTFTLAVEYIKLVVRDTDAYRRILAVTFTNKATAEMKLRILGQLYGIGHGLAGSEGYLAQLRADAEIARRFPTDEAIRGRALEALERMMHDFGRFRIETIDSFFQSVVRELARELNLTANLRVDLNDAEVLAEAVRSLVDGLPRDPALLELVFGLICERIGQGENWRIDGEMVRFGRNIFNEKYLADGKRLRAALRQEGRVAAYRQALWRERARAEERLRGIGAAFVGVCGEAGVDASCLCGGNGPGGIYAFFAKLAGGKRPSLSPTVLSFASGARPWLSKKGEMAGCGGAVDGRLRPLLREAVACYRTLGTAEAVLRHVGQLLLIGRVDERVRQLNADANRFLLADTAHLLSELIEDSDVPFIYERTGARFSHIMIDEFQDTSALQWENFVPLLQNSLSTGSESLIVGDVKQSIYRWRNSDWNILNAIGEHPLFAGRIELLPLQTNYRSGGRIVDFNNGFFARAADELSAMYEARTGRGSDTLRRAYAEAEVRQRKREEADVSGYVRVELLERAEGEPASVGELELARLAEGVRGLRGAGVAYGDMAILVRTKGHIAAICAYLAGALRDPSLRVVSDEAFRLDASPALQVLVGALNVVASPDDRYLRTLLLCRYRAVSAGGAGGMGLDALLRLDRRAQDALLPPGFAGHEAELAVVPLFELCERLYVCFGLERVAGQDAYLHAFFDQLSAYLRDNASDIAAFLRCWDETLRAQTIPNATADGIRVMTIHKSKGLQFHTVIVPFCEWKFKNAAKAPLLWCEPHEAPFDGLPLLPVKDEAALAQTAFADDYADELLKTYVDNVNLVYVAFTRAEKNLLVIAGRDKPKKRGEEARPEDVFHLVRACVPAPAPCGDAGAGLSAYCCGEMVASGVAGRGGADDGNVLTRAPESADAPFFCGGARVEFRQSNQSAAFVGGGEEGGGRSDYVDDGLVFHSLLADIRRPADIDRALARLGMEGCIASAEHAARIRRLVAGALSDTAAARWFDARWTVLNERSIVCRGDGGGVVERRPDRVITDGRETVVIDYKTGRQSPLHAAQVHGYVELLRQMGYPRVSGYLWYVRRGDIVRVD